MNLPVLIIQTAFLGDLILTIPLLNSALALWPERDIFLVVRKGLGKLFANFPEKLHVLEDDKKLLFPQTSFYKKIKKLKPEIVLLPHRSHRSSLIAFLSGATTRVGFKTAGFSMLLTHKVPYSPQTHEAERILSLLQPFSREFYLKIPWFRFLPFKEEEMRKKWTHVLKEPYVLISPFTNWETKNWGDEKWASLITILLRKCDVNFVITGTQDKVKRSEKILFAVDTMNRIFNLTGTTDLTDLIFLVKESTVVVCGDSSPVHIASSLNVPVVAIYGPTDPKNGFGPLSHESFEIGVDLPCRPCSPHGPANCPLGHHQCMKNISPEKVAEIILKVLKNRRIC